MSTLLGDNIFLDVDVATKGDVFFGVNMANVISYDTQEMVSDLGHSTPLVKVAIFDEATLTIFVVSIPMTIMNSKEFLSMVEHLERSCKENIPIEEQALNAERETE
jgi:hypothetical protein